MALLFFASFNVHNWGMFFRRFYDNNLAQASYLLACDHARVGLVVDPNRNIAQYIAAAATENIKIVAVTETHIHADFVSGARELAARSGARLYLSDAGGHDCKYRFASDANAELLTDGSHFMIGDVRVDAIHTPGHTPEHLTFLLTETALANEPIGALTGDFVFVGDVGRPDLLERAAGMAGTMKASAHQLFQSLQSFKAYPAYLQLWPGHGAGSACGKALGSMPQSTLGYETLFNWALAEQDEERFVVDVLSGQPEPPAYFAKMKKINRDGPTPASVITPPIGSADDFAQALQNEEVVLDTRAAAEFGAMHAKGSINIPRNKSFLHWAGALLPYDRAIRVVGDTADDARRDLAADLSLIGLDWVAGVFSSDALVDLGLNGIAMQAAGQISVPDATKTRDGWILDVRGREEYAAGHIPHAINIPLAELQRRLKEVPPGRLIVHCQGGSRSAIASSILLSTRGDDVRNMPGGFAEWERAGNRVEKGAVTDET